MESCLSSSNREQNFLLSFLVAHVLSCCSLIFRVYCTTDRYYRTAAMSEGEIKQQNISRTKELQQNSQQANVHSLLYSRSLSFHQVLASTSAIEHCHPALVTVVGSRTVLLLSFSSHLHQNFCFDSNLCRVLNESTITAFLPAHAHLFK